MTGLTTGSIQIGVVGDREWRQRLGFVSQEMGREVESAIEESLLLLEGEMKGMVSGDPGAVLNKRTGTLFRSIHHTMQRRGMDSSGTVGTPVIYARTHELGLTIDYPSRGTSITFPRRAFVQPSFEKHEDAIVRKISRAVGRAVQQ